MTTEITAATPAAQPAPAAADPSEVVVAGQTVKVASPDEVNEIDLGANDAAPQTNDAAPVSVAAGTPPLHETSEPAPKSDAVKAFAVARAATAERSRQHIVDPASAGSAWRRGHRRHGRLVLDRRHAAADLRVSVIPAAQRAEEMKPGMTELQPLVLSDVNNS